MAEAAVVIHTDGASKGNPGHASIAYVIAGADGQVIASHGRYIGKETNNVAEYTALVEALAAARDLGAAQVEAFSDSELMVKQVSGAYRVKNENLRPLYEKVVAGLRAFASATLTHVPREQNREADKLAGAAIKAHLDAEKKAADEAGVEAAKATAKGAAPDPA